MVWHEVVAWVVIAAAMVAAIVWLVKLIVCPKSKCEGCNKSCILKSKNNKRN